MASESNRWIKKRFTNPDHKHFIESSPSPYLPPTASDPKLTADERENLEWREQGHNPSEVVRVEKRPDATKRRRQHDSARPLGAILLRTLLIPAPLFRLEGAQKLHRYARAEAVSKDEHVLRRGTPRAEPVPRRTGVEGQPCLAGCARRVAKAAVVERKDVRAQAGGEGLVVPHARRRRSCGGVPV